MVRKQVKVLTVLYLVPCQHFGVYFAPYQILLVMGAVFVLLEIPLVCATPSTRSTTATTFP